MKKTSKPRSSKSAHPAPPPRSFNDRARLASRIVSPRPQPPRSPWAATPELSALRNALSAGRDEAVFDALGVKGLELSERMLNQAFGVSVVHGALLSAQRLLEMGADPGEVARADGELEGGEKDLPRYETPMTLALENAHWELAQWLARAAGARAMEVPKGSRGPYCVIALARGFSPLTRTQALAWARERSSAPAPIEAGLMALGGAFDALKALWESSEPEEATRLARASLSGLASLCAEPGVVGEQARETLERAIGLSQEKCEPALGIWDPREAKAPEWGRAALSESIRDKIDRQGFRVGSIPPKALGWPRLCAVMRGSHFAFEALGAIEPSARELHEISLWEASARQSLTDKSAWTASSELFPSSYGGAWIPDERHESSLVEKIDRIGAWLERQSLERVSTDSGKARKQRDKKSARAQRRAALRDGREPEAQPEPIPARRPRL